MISSHTAVYLIQMCTLYDSSPYAYGHLLMLSGRGHQCAAFSEGLIGMSVCCIKKPAERDGALDWLTQDPVLVNAH